MKRGASVQAVNSAVRNTNFGSLRCLKGKSKLPTQVAMRNGLPGHWLGPPGCWTNCNDKSRHPRGQRLNPGVGMAGALLLDLVHALARVVFGGFDFDPALLPGGGKEPADAVRLPVRWLS